MAQDLQALVVSLSADIKKFENAMNRANGISNKQMRAVEARAKKMNSNLSASFASAGKGFAGAFAAAGALKGAQSLIDTSTRISNALKVAGQSGEQLNVVYDSLFASAQKNAAPIEDLVTLYGRASQSATDLGVSQQELLKFTDNVALSLRVGGTSAQEASGALLQLSQALGNGVVQAEEYNSLLDGAQPLLQATAAGLKEAGGSVSALTRLVKDGKVSSKAFFRAFEAGASTLQDKVGGSQLTVSQGFTRLQNILIDTARQFDNNSDAAVLLAQTIDRMARAMKESGNIINSLVGPLEKLHGWVSAVTTAALEMSAAFGAATGLDEVGRSLGATPYRSDRQIQQRINDAFGATATEDKPGTTLDVTGGKPIRPVSLADYKVPAKATKAKGAPAVKKTADSRFNDDIQATKDRTAALAEETAMVGKGYEAQERRRMALDLEQSALADLREEARRKGQTDLENIKLSDDQKAKIDEVSAAYANQANELRKVQDAQDKSEQAAGEFYDTFKSGAIDAITGAKSLGDALSDLAKKLGDMLLNQAFDSLFKPASGNDAGGSFGNIFSGLGKIMGFAGGTNNAPGGLAWVGEKGPELMNVPKGAQIIPNHRLTAPSMPPLRGVSGGGQSVVVNFNPTIDNRGASVEAVARTEQALAQMRRELPATIVATVRKANQSNVKLR
ncbi:tape measure protein [Phyllobacterium zundukense]|uniref:Tape measure protein n=1 Tax=Phyllobacterium zundukense TaxID=1867719 RepID=A0ACD4D741_9HYPH|nr:tape measure protein [Phyllobacterium zundukense]UXN61564.1 tape measure protein [Phyllobacterium zundukense]